MIIDKPPKNKTVSTRYNVLKDGNIVLEDQYPTVAFTIKGILEQLKPEHTWSLDRFELEPLKPFPKPESVDT